jgi:hypothetical protein
MRSYIKLTHLQPLIVDMPMEKERKLTPQEAESILAHIKKFPPSIDTSAKAASPPASPKKSPINGGASRPPRRTDQGSGTPGAPPSPSLGRSTTLGKLGKRAFDLKAISDETVPILVKRVFTPTPDWVLIGYHGTTAVSHRADMIHVAKGAKFTYTLDISSNKRLPGTQLME